MEIILTGNLASLREEVLCGGEVHHKFLLELLLYAVCISGLLVYTSSSRSPLLRTTVFVGFDVYCFEFRCRWCFQLQSSEFLGFVLRDHFLPARFAEVRGHTRAPTGGGVRAHRYAEV